MRFLMWFVVATLTQLVVRVDQAAVVRTSSDSIKLDIVELQKLGISIDDVIRHIQLIADGRHEALGRCLGLTGAGDGSSLTPAEVQRTSADQSATGDLHRLFIRNKTVTCNDGSKAGYYIRRSQNGNRLWMVFLEGGWLCFDQKSCEGRWVNLPHLMSSDNWPLTRRGSGILSWDPTENPFIHDGNIVLIPYCSSDTWSGTYKSIYRGDFSFMGSQIIEEVIRDLVSFHNLATATTVFLAGSSAGGTGVLLNIDRVGQQLSQLAPDVLLRGIVDSGWFLDNQPFRYVQCAEAHQCSPSESVERGIKLWRGLVPDSCRGFYPASEQWRCYFGYRLYQSLQSVVFIIQNQFDEAQITVDNVGAPVHHSQWRYIRNIGVDMRHTLDNVSAVFAPACLSHIILTRSEWRRVTIDGVSLPDALICWESGGRSEKNHYGLMSSNEHPHPRSGSHHHQQQHLDTRQRTLYPVPRLITGEGHARRREGFQADSPGGSTRSGGVSIRHHHGRRQHQLRERELRRRRRQRRRNSKRKQRRNRKQPKIYAINSTSLTPSDDSSTSGHDGTAGERRRRRASLVFDVHDIHHVQQHANLCHHRLVDTCVWPQCNLSCPKVRNPFTGDEMDFIDLLMQFGLDLSAIADALHVDLPTLQAMDHAHLLRLLVQNTR